MSNYNTSGTTASFSLESTNYQNTLHAEALLTTTPDQWPQGCTVSPLGVPSEFLAVERLSSGAYEVDFALDNADSVTVDTTDVPLTSVQSSNNYATPGIAATLLSVDVTGDGKPDLVVLSYNSSTDVATLSVFPGNGDGTYGTRADYPTDLLAVHVTVADVNGDGAPDLIVVGPPASENQSDPAVQVFLNDGTGKFGSPINGPALSYDAYEAVTGNFGGSHLDIATNDGHVLDGDGTGNFTLAANTFPGADGLAAGDFNRDGKTDLVTSAVNGTLSILLGNGDGTFTAGPSYASIWAGYSVHVADLDGDGNPDIIVGDADQYGLSPDYNTQSYVYFLLGRGDGTFAGVPSYHASNGAPFTVADFNDDNKPDIATVSGSSLYLLEGNGDGTFTPGGTTATSVVPNAMVSADFNADSKSDLLLAATISGPSSGTPASGELATFLGNGNGTFGSEIDSPSFGASAQVLAAAPFHGSSVLDAIVGGVATTDSLGNPATGALFILTGDGQGKFQSPSQIGAPLNPVSIATGDFNADGKTDLVVADGGAPYVSPTPIEGNVLVYLGNGNGTFGTPSSLNAPAFPQAVAVADINQDGKPDIVVMSSPAPGAFPYASTIYAFLGDGAGGFGSPIKTVIDQAGAGLAVADLDGDGLPDLAISSCCGDTNTETWTGNGNGTFNGPEDLPILISSKSVQLADVNNDKRLDLLVSANSSIGVALNESGSVKPPPTPVPALLEITPHQLSFGKIALGTTSKPKLVHIVNRKSRKLSVSVTISGESSTSAAFAVTQCAEVLPPGAECTVSVTFSPGQTTTRQSATLDINDDVRGAPQTVQLSGAGKASKKK